MRLFTALLITLFLSGPFQAHAQNPADDSAAYYKKELAHLWHNAWDSLRASTPYITAMDGLNRYSALTNAYTAFYLYAELAGVDYDQFNRSIALTGFGPLQGPIFRIGYGMSMETGNRLVCNIDFTTFGFNNRSTGANGKIRSSFSNVFQVNLGYDIDRATGVNIYPYGGLALRIANLSYSKTAQVNNNYTSITDIVQNDPSVYSSSFRAAYQAGIGFDFVISKNKRAPNRNNGVMLSLQIGTDGSIGKESYKIDGLTYDPGIHHGDWVATLGFKFFGRK